MAKKRKSDANRLDEMERSMHSTFCSAANSLSQLYTMAMSQQKLSFQAGERHALEKLYQWILMNHGETSRVTTADIVGYIQHEIDYVDTTTFSRNQAPPQHLPQPTILSTNPSVHISSDSRPAQNMDQIKNPVFANALSSPIRRSLQSYQLPQENIQDTSRDGEANSSDQNNKDHPNLNDSSMDMH